MDLGANGKLCLIKIILFLNCFFFLSLVAFSCYQLIVKKIRKDPMHLPVILLYIKYSSAFLKARERRH